MGLLKFGARLLFGGGIGAVGEGVAKAATPFTDAWARARESAAAMHQVDRETDRAITVESFRADIRFGELQAAAAALDRADKRTSWMRPAFAVPSLFYAVALVLQHTMPGAARALGIEVTMLPYPWNYIVAAIPGVLFGLRPLEKWARSSAIGAAQKATPLPAASRQRGRDDRAGT